MKKSEAETRARREAEELEKKEREGVRQTFAERVANARRVAKGGDYLESKAGAKALLNLLENHSRLLDNEQRAEAAALLEAVGARAERLRPEFERAEALKNERLRADAERAGAEVEARIRAERARLEEMTPGLAEDGTIEDVERVPAGKLEELLEGADDAMAERIMRELERREAERGSRGNQEEGDFLDELARIKLPASDKALGGELAELTREWMTPRQRMNYVRRDGSSLDDVAGALREKGFTEVMTPADVIEFAKRALGGERIMPSFSREREANDTRSYGVDPQQQYQDEQYRQSRRARGAASDSVEFSAPAQGMLGFAVPAGVGLPAEIRNLTPNWQDKRLLFES
ncbi:MAG: hypothetical protein LBM92_01870, partial [Opitutaceae bacterium]|nr:hypothetical protein [Opitutaceae bacterium]